MSFKIASTGSYMPEKVVTNDDLSKIMDTSDEWIIQRVGIKERRISTEETTSDLAYKASLSALEWAKIAPEELDLIICATATSEFKFPTVAAVVQKKIGANCPAFDINSACSGFIYGLEVATGFLAMKKVKKILLVAADRMSSVLDWKDRNIAVLFGDGAGAVVLEEGDSLLASTLSTIGDDETIKCYNFEGNSPFYKSVEKPLYTFMKGQETFRFAVTTMIKGIEEVAKIAGIAIEDIDFVIPHQANMRIIDVAKKKLNLPPERVCSNIEKYGNMSAASIPILLDELNRAGTFKQGDIIAFSAFGAGLSSAAAIIKW